MADVILNDQEVKSAFLKAIGAGKPEKILTEKIKKLIPENKILKILALGKAASSMAETIIKLQIGFEGIIIAYGLSYLIFSFPVFKMLTTVKPDFGIFKTKFGFLTNNYLYDLSSVANGQIDKLIIAPMFGFILLGNYYLGLQIIGFLGILPGIVFNYILPQDATGHSTTQVKKITLLFSVGFTLIGIFLIR